MTEKIHHYTLCALQEIFPLSQSIAGHFPDPPQVMTAIYELLLNALEHGNLEIGAKTKALLLQEGRWETEVMHRLSLPQYSNREVKISIIEENGECRLVIADQGQGFHWKKYLRKEVNPHDPHGRGLLIAFNAGFDRVIFNEAGNIVTCVMTVAP